MEKDIKVELRCETVSHYGALRASSNDPDAIILVENNDETFSIYRNGKREHKNLTPSELETLKL